MNEMVTGVVDAIKANRTKFEAFCYSLDESQLGRPVPDSTWIVRDFAAHLGTLDTEMVRWFRAAASGVENPAPTDASGAPLDIDTFNDAEVARRRDWPLKRVFDEAGTNRAELIAMMSGLTQEQIDVPLRFAGDNKRGPGNIPFKLFLAGWAQHDPIHVADMMKALPERAADPELKQWLENPFVAGYQKAMSGPPRT
jgi:hypothetical protein